MRLQEPRASPFLVQGFCPPPKDRLLDLTNRLTGLEVKKRQQLPLEGWRESPKETELG